MPRAAHIVILKRIGSLCALTIGLAIVPAYADEDPFQMDTAHWMSFDHYKDADKRGVLPAAGRITTPEIPGAADAAPTPADSVVSQSVAVPATPVALATPTRPLNLPVMPALNKGFAVQVSSTQDSIATPPPILAADAPAGTEADLHISDKYWQNPASVMNTKNNAQTGDEDTQPLAVRMTYLPDSKITPIPTPDKVTAQHKARIALEKGMITQKPVAEKTPAQVAACAAIDAYKKQQLNAIQSDRQTLKALQDAIASLGLQKQLNFMTDTDGSLSAAATQTPLGQPAASTVQ